MLPGLGEIARPQGNLKAILRLERGFRLSVISGVHMP